MTINKYVENPLVYYVYDVGFLIFNNPDLHSYIVIHSDEITFDSEDNIEFITMPDWFDEVLNCSILAWVCACIDKKYILKEYVKLTMTTDPIKLRKNYEAILTFFNQSHTKGYGLAWMQQIGYEILYTLIFSIQIINNHKIVNFNEPTDHYKKIHSMTSIESIIDYVFLNSVDLEKKLKELTDGILKEEMNKKIRKMIKQQSNEVNRK